jgi:DNA-binding PadR family transcriptional regulator
MGATHAADWGCGRRGELPWSAFAKLGAIAAMTARHHGRRPGGPRGRGRERAPWSWPGGPLPPGFGPPGFGPFGGRHGWGRGPRSKRGNVRAAILALLAEEPRNGYQIIQEINERSGGAWKPSPGAVYPALSQLADEGLIRGEEGEGRKTFQLTEAGRAYVDDHPDEVRAPWEDMTADLHDDVHALFRLAGQTGMAVVQVAQAASPAQLAQASDILSETRRKLYRLLAEDEEGDQDDQGDAAEPGAAAEGPTS